MGRNVAGLKHLASEAIEQQAQRISDISDHIMHNPETGFREAKTAAFVAEQLRDLGVAHRTGLALTGVKGRLPSGSPGPTVAILGELDALIVPANPFADATTGAAHACGHNAQIASMIGAGIGLQAVMSELAGDVVLFAVPAEECIEVEWRMDLRHRGAIEFLCGKAELVRLGEFDDVDLAMLTHTQVGDGTLASVGDTHNGAMIKRVTFHGRSAHAGSAPWLGVNALRAANVALTAIDAQRDTFREVDTVRVHLILTKSGTSVSSVPAEASIEMMIRARTVDAMAETSMKVDRALRSGAMALGATVEIETVLGYLPHVQDERLVDLMAANCASVVTTERMGEPWHRTGSTDMGDLSQIMPVVQPRTGGGHGRTHSDEYYVEDHYLAAVNPAKFMAMTVIDLLSDDASEARRILNRRAAQLMTKDEYLSVRRRFDSHESYFDGAAGPDPGSVV